MERFNTFMAPKDRGTDELAKRKAEIAARQARERDLRANALWKFFFGSWKSAVSNHGGRLNYSPNGYRGCARRMRQIEAGQLRRENGLAA